MPVEPIAEIQAAILGRTKNFWARDADTVETRKIDFHTAEIRFRDRGTEIRLIVGIDPITNNLLISGDCVSDTPGVQAIQWGIDKLNLTNLRLIVPSDKRQVFDAASQIKQANLIYPSNGGFYIRGEDPTFQFKELYYFRYIDTFGLGFRSQINIVPNPDINRDGQINVLDLILIANKFGQPVPQASPGALMAMELLISSILSSLHKT